MQQSETNYDKIYTVPAKLELAILDSRESFNQLTHKEKMYAYMMYKSSWAGAPIISKQISPESHYLMKLFSRLFNEHNVYALKNNYTEDPNLVHLVNYVAMLFSNMGNYLSFGDTKFVPRMTRTDMDYLMRKYFVDYVTDYEKVADQMFSLDDGNKTLGYPPNGITMYFSLNMTQEEIKIVDKYVIFK